MQRSFDIASIIYKSFQEELTAEESQKLEQWRAESDQNEATYQSLLDNGKALSQMEIYQQFDSKSAWNAIENQIETVKVVPLFQKVLRYAAVILLPLTFAAGWFFYTQQNDNPLAGIDEEITPGAPQAILTLADGSEITLDPEQSIEEIQQGKATVKTQNAEVVYEETKTKTNPIQPTYNHLTTPKGGTYKVTLSDGTRVTLNADSKLSYPTAFNNQERAVELLGEAFFEVSHDQNRPFIVKTRGQNVTVLGTKFDVMAYLNDESVKTTLVEGSVRVDSRLGREVLAPGEQSVLSQNLLIIDPVNTDLYTSWVNGKFQFGEESMEQVLKKLSRWYDFEYTFENEAAKGLHFTGRIDNQQEISSILKMIEVTTSIKFEYEDDVVIIQKTDID